MIMNIKNALVKFIYKYGIYNFFQKKYILILEKFMSW